MSQQRYDTRPYNREQSPQPGRTTRVEQLAALADATRKRFGTSSQPVRIPARLIVDFDPWALSLDMEVTNVSLASARAEIDLSRLPADTRKILATGDSYRVQFPGPQPIEFRNGGTNSDVDFQKPVLPLLLARLEQIETVEGSTRVHVRFKWQYDPAAEREFRKFLNRIEQGVPAQ